MCSDAPEQDSCACMQLPQCTTSSRSTGAPGCGRCRPLIVRPSLCTGTGDAAASECAQQQDIDTSVCVDRGRGSALLGLPVVQHLRRQSTQGAARSAICKCTANTTPYEGSMRLLTNGGSSSSCPRNGNLLAQAVLHKGITNKRSSSSLTECWHVRTWPKILLCVTFVMAGSATGLTIGYTYCAPSL